MLLLWIGVLSCVPITEEPTTALRHVVVYREEGRFAGWPANHGIWAWGDEILVGFSRGYYQDRGPFHHIDKEKPEEFLLAAASTEERPGRSRSLSRGAFWPARRGCVTGSCRRVWTPIGCSIYTNRFASIILTSR